jgi:hypothetical protein
MRTIILLTLFLGLFYFGADETYAQCTCIPEYVDITAHNKFKFAHVVFIGKVIEMKKSARDKDGDYTEIVTFRVSKAWKRDLEPAVVITNRIDGCLNGFEEKEDWLVYAYKDRDGALGTYCCCSRTKPLSKAGEDLKEFEERGEKPKKIRATQSSFPQANQ